MWRRWWVRITGLEYLENLWEISTTDGSCLKEILDKLNKYQSLRYCFVFGNVCEICGLSVLLRLLWTADPRVSVLEFLSRRGYSKYYRLIL